MRSLYPCIYKFVEVFLYSQELSDVSRDFIYLLEFSNLPLNFDKFLEIGPKMDDFYTFFQIFRISLLCFISVVLPSIPQFLWRIRSFYKTSSEFFLHWSPKIIDRIYGILSFPPWVLEFGFRFGQKVRARVRVQEPLI
jgi:hypothetical protein